MSLAISNERGTTMAFVALSMTALLSIVALAVDVGMLFNTRSEAQRAADSAALAGAGSLIVQPGDADRAHGVATQYGERNTVYGDLADLLAEDVDVDLAQGRVTVTVSRLNSRGNSVPTWFARFFGADEVDVAARAVAEVAPAGSATCVKPLTIPDRFWDKDGDGEFDPGVDEYDPEVHGYGTDWRNPGAQGDDGEGYDHDYGRTVNLKQGGPGEHQPSWWYPWDMPHIAGAPAVGGQQYRLNLTPTRTGTSSKISWQEARGLLPGRAARASASFRSSIRRASSIPGSSQSSSPTSSLSSSKIYKASRKIKRSSGGSCIRGGLAAVKRLLRI